MYTAFPPNRVKPLKTLSQDGQISRQQSNHSAFSLNPTFRGSDDESGGFSRFLRKVAGFFIKIVDEPESTPKPKKKSWVEFFYKVVDEPARQETPTQEKPKSFWQRNFITIIEPEPAPTVEPDEDNLRQVQSALQEVNQKLEKIESYRSQFETALQQEQKKFAALQKRLQVFQQIKVYDETTGGSIDRIQVLVKSGVIDAYKKDIPLEEQIRELEEDITYQDALVDSIKLQMDTFMVDYETLKPQWENLRARLKEAEHQIKSSQVYEKVQYEKEQFQSDEERIGDLLNRIQYEYDTKKIRMELDSNPDAELRKARKQKTS